MSEWPRGNVLDWKRSGCWIMIPLIVTHLWSRARLVYEPACWRKPRTKNYPEQYKETKDHIAKFNLNKTVVLRERKRHTTRRVASTFSAVLSREGVPQSCFIWGTPVMARGYPLPGSCLGLGYPPPIWDWVTPRSHLGPVTGVPRRTWDQWKYYGMEIGYTPPPPPGMDGQSENFTFPILLMRAVKTVSSLK